MTLRAEIIDGALYVSEDQVDARLTLTALAGPETQVAVFLNVEDAERLQRTLGFWIEGERHRVRPRT